MWTVDLPVGLMHNKFCVVDGEIVLTGSFNWTHTAATESYENEIVTNDRLTALEYVDYFGKILRGKNIKLLLAPLST